MNWTVPVVEGNQTMPVDQEQGTPHFFTLRIWLEEVEDGRSEVRGQLKHVLTRETSYFREWSDLQALLCRHIEPRSKPD